ncbi:MAG: glycosyltransferase family 4 protein [Ignavibacteriae bacterium]|nr:glycosyltransferase family 4 protein [Ignavibacteriota bacterium]
MRIGIDARLLSTKIRGTARYLSNLIEYLPQFDNKNKYFIFQYEDLGQKDKYYTYIPIKKSKLPRQIHEHYWLNFKLPKLILENKIDIFFTPYIFVPLIKKKWKNVIAIHDTLTKVSKEYYTFYYRKYMDLLVPLSVKRSDAIITVSESAMNDIIKFYKVDPNKIQYLHLWTDDKYKQIKLSLDKKKYLMEKYNLPQKFILFVGVLEERKNIIGILKVAEILLKRGIDINFVFVGREGFGFHKVSDKFKNSSKRFLHLKEVDDSDLVSIYNIATLFFFPTYYEGFGLPPLEAMKCGLPVIASNNSSIPEVVGNGGILGDAENYDFFADKISLLLNDENLYNNMKQNALKQAEKFTAENHIRKLLGIFNNLNNH